MRLTYSSILDGCFLTLNVLFFCSFNGIIDMLFGVGQVASPIILVVCCILLGTMGFRPGGFLKTAVLLYSLLILTYFGIGAFSRLFNDVTMQYDVSNKNIVNKVVTSLVVIFTYLQYFYQRLYLDGEFKKILRYLFLPMLASITILVVQPMFGIYGFDARDGYDRAMGVFANPNTAALIANITLVFTIDNFFRSRSYWPVKLFLIIVAIWACIVPFSRTGLVVMFATLIVAMLYFLVRPSISNKSHWLQGLIFIGIPILVGNYVYINHDQLLVEHLSYAQRSRILTLEQVVFKGVINNKTTSDRTEVAEIAANKIKTRPIFGHGLGHFESMPGSIGVHNTYLLTIGNSGVIPLVFLIILFLYLFPIALLRPRTGFLIAGLTTVAFLSFLTSHNGYDDKIMNILLLLPVAFAGYDRWRKPKSV